MGIRELDWEEKQKTLMTFLLFRNTDQTLRDKKKEGKMDAQGESQEKKRREEAKVENKRIKTRKKLKEKTTWNHITCLG